MKDNGRTTYAQLTALRNEQERQLASMTNTLKTWIDQNTTPMLLGGSGSNAKDWFIYDNTTHQLGTSAIKPLPPARQMTMVETPNGVDIFGDEKLIEAYIKAKPEMLLRFMALVGESEDG